MPNNPVIRFTVDAPSADLAVGTVEHLISASPALLQRSFDTAGSSVALATVTPPDIADVTENDDGTYRLTSTVSVSQVPTAWFNPFPPGIDTLDWMSTIATDPALARQIAAVDPSAAFTVTQSEGRRAPILNTTVTASSAELAYEIHELVIGRLEAELEALQTDAGVGQNVRTTFRSLLPPSEPALTASSMVRALAGVVVLGGGLALGSAVVADAFVMRRRMRSAKPTEVSAAPIVAEAAPPRPGAGVTVESEEPAAVAAADAARSPAAKPTEVERGADRRGGCTSAARCGGDGRVGGACGRRRGGCRQIARGQADGGQRGADRRGGCTSAARCGGDGRVGGACGRRRGGCRQIARGQADGGQRGADRRGGCTSAARCGGDGRVGGACGRRRGGCRQIARAAALQRACCAASRGRRRSRDTYCRIEWRRRRAARRGAGHAAVTISPVQYLRCFLSSSF